MNPEQLMSNLDSVRGEVRGIVDNIRAVRGDRHAALTLGFLHVSTLTDVARLLAETSQLPDEILERVREVYLHCLAEAIRGFCAAAEFPQGEIDAAISEASSVENSVQSMASTAWNMAQDGRNYGGTD